MATTINQVITLGKRWLLAFITPRPLVGLLYIPRFVRDWYRYGRRAKADKPKFIDSYPCLTDWLPYTPFDPHYFFQGAWLARGLAQHKPILHVDVASSVLTIGTVSAQVDTVFVDYRPIRANLTGMLPIAGNIVNLPFASNSLASLSCLHVIEHIGLGRYGDAIDAAGSIKAARELQRVLATGGMLFLSTPVGRERVCFNAGRIFAPESIPAMLPELEVVEFSFVDDAGRFLQKQPLAAAKDSEYGCGMYVFRKPGR